MINRIDGGSSAVPRGTPSGQNDAAPASPKVAMPAKDGFVPGAARPLIVMPGPGGGSGPSAPLPPAQVIQNQQDLVTAREQLGQAMQTLEEYQTEEQNSPFWELMPWNWGKLDSAQNTVNQDKTRLQNLQKTETTQESSFGNASVERARYDVFGQQLTMLENKYGKNTAAQLARQVYYNNTDWDLGTNTLPADESDLLMTGLPDKDEALALAPNGDEIDMSHVFTALDVQLNPPLIGGLTVADASLVGDLAQASLTTMSTLKQYPDFASSVKANFQGYASSPQLLGDVDGLNLAAQLASNRNAGLATTFNGYFGSQGPTNRMSMFAATSPFIERNASGPVVDAKGHYVLNLKTLEAATMQFAKTERDNQQKLKLLHRDYNAGWDGVSDAQLDESVPAIVAGQFQAWFGQEQTREGVSVSPPIAAGGGGHGVHVL